MADVFVDPVIVTTPEDDATREEIDFYLNNLAIWLKEALSSPYPWLHAIKAANHLLECGRYPDSHLLRLWQRRYGLNVNIYQLDRMINAFFRNPELDFETYLANAGYLIEPVPGSIVIHPDQFSVRLLDAVREDIHLLLAMACGCRQMQSSVVDKLHIATLALVGLKKEIAVTTLISASEPDFDWNVESMISHIFPLLFTPDDLSPPLNIIPLWDKGEDGIRYAIDRWYKQDWQSQVPEPLAYRLGPHFIESAHECGLDTNGDVLLKIVRIAATVIADQAKNIKAYKLHPLRESEAADSPQRIRANDDARAWRLMIDKHGAGWRLHYWRIPAPNGGIIEFSNVQKESGSKIY